MSAVDNRIGRIITVFLVACALGSSAPIYAAPLSWNDIAGGPASDANNWSPVQVPAAADDLTFNLANTYTVSWNATVNSSDTHTYRQGTVTNTVSSPHTVATGITIGDTAGFTPIMTLTTGTLTSNASMVVGSISGSMGTLNVDDDDADLIVAGATSDLTIGSGGDAAMNITGSGLVEVADQFVAGANSTSSPTISVSGFTAAPLAASTLRVLGTSQSRIGAGGDATLTISTGALADFAGDLVIANGSASNSSVTVQTIGLLNARLLVDGDLLVGRNANAGIAAGTGQLNINTGGTATVGGDTLVGDPDGGTGTIVLNGGTFNGTLPVQLTVGSAITGTGTVNADVNVGAGSILATTPTGLTLNGIVNCTTAGVFGTKIHFGPNGGYLGSGTCDADITGDPASTITATGTLSIGNNTTSGYSYLGTLVVDGNIVTLVDSNGAVLGGLSTINSGRIECPAGIGLQNGATIQGDGLLVGTLTAAGVVDPHSTGSSGGLITVQGNLQMNPTGIVDIEIGGTPASGDYDKVVVSGSATFGGTIRVKLKNGYIPKVGQQFIAVNATTGRIGEFDNIALDATAANVCNEVTYVLVYSSTAAIVLIRPPLGCTALGDLNSNGGCDGRDIPIFMDALLNGPYDSCADLDGDCTNDLDDVTIFVNCLI